MSEPKSQKKRQRKPRRRREARGPPQAPLLKVQCRNISQKSVAEITKILLEVLPSSSCFLRVDEAFFERLVLQEHAVQARQEAEKENEQDEEDTKVVEKKISATESAMEESKPLDDNQVALRCLYIVPCRDTKRRGTQSGHAYLVLSSSNNTEKEHATQELAKRRVLLSRASDIVVKSLQDDPRTSNWQVHEALNQRAWKTFDAAAMNSDKNIGSIFETPDYKAFVEERERQAQALQARPKPAPGGGAISAATSNEGSSGPVSAIVAYLQKKQAQERNKQRKKNEAAKKKSAASKAPQQRATKAKVKKTKKKGGNTASGSKPAS